MAAPPCLHSEAAPPRHRTRTAAFAQTEARTTRASCTRPRKAPTGADADRQSVTFPEDRRRTARTGAIPNVCRRSDTDLLAARRWLNGAAEARRRVNDALSRRL